MKGQEIDTLFLDAGGVICHPSWTRVSRVLADHGVVVTAERLIQAQPFAKKDIDDGQLIGATTDASRGWLYFDKVLDHAGVPRSAATDQALEELHAYHNRENLWEHVPDEVAPTLARLRGLGLRLVVVSNANGRLRHLFERLGLTPAFDVVLDSHEWGVEKPDPRLFELALQRSGATASTTVHVGDLFHIDVVGARRAGLREGILLDAADLYQGVDCRRVRTLEEVIAVVAPGAGGSTDTL